MASLAHTTVSDAEVRVITRWLKTRHAHRRTHGWPSWLRRLVYTEEIRSSSLLLCTVDFLDEVVQWQYFLIFFVLCYVCCMHAMVRCAMLCEGYASGAAVNR